MKVLKVPSPQSMTNVAYVSCLMTFAALGTFVYALATGSALAIVLGSVLVACATVMVAGFRVGVRRRAASNESGIEIDGANVWAQPLRRDQIDRYLLQYRGVEAVDAHDAPLAAVADNARSSVTSRLAA